MRVSFIVPAYNEAATIAEVLERVEALDLDKQVIVVDDGSTDDTPRLLEAWTGRNGTVVLRQENRGKGAAIRAAIPHLDGEITVIQDADLEYDPAEVPGSSSRSSAARPTSSTARGSRAAGRSARTSSGTSRKPLPSLLTNVLYNTTLSDMETGYKAFRTDVLRSLDLHEDDFAIEPEITAKVCQRNLRIYELPISYYGRTYAEGKKITWRDGIKAIVVLFRVRLRG